MQKKLIALAVAGLASSAAFAQTNVTIYGIVDAYVGHATSNRASGSDDNVFNGVNGGGLSGSRIGFKGEEALGNGLKALFLWEFGTMAVDGGSGVLGSGSNGIGSTRQSYLGLATDKAGTFTGGRLYSPGHNFGVKYDAEGASIFSPVRAMTGNIGLAIDGNGTNQARQNSAVAWDSPNWSGFTMRAQYAFGEQNASNGGTKINDTKAWSLGGNYDMGPLSVGLVYSQINNDVAGGVSSAAAFDPDLREWGLGASYDFKVVKLVGSYQHFKQDDAATVTGAGVVGAEVKGRIWNIGAIIPVMANGSVRLTYANLGRDARASAGASSLSQDAKAYGLSYQHALSKRTTAYVGYSHVTNDKRSTINTYVGSSSLAAPAADENASGFAVGMRHTF